MSDRSRRDAVHDLDAALRSRGLLFPDTDEEVAAAEARIEEAKIALPESLADAGQVFERIVPDYVQQLRVRKDELESLTNFPPNAPCKYDFRPPLKRIKAS